MKVTFLGAVGTVTGSKFLVETQQTKLLIDCGLFQGLKDLRLRNWQALPFAPAELDAVILTHAHLDHSGYLPLLVRNGFKGPIFCSAPTGELCKILLPDSGRINEEDAEHANRKGYSRHQPAAALYNEADALNCLPLLQPKEIDQRHQIGDLAFRLERVGHILGATSVTLFYQGRSLVFSGDIGRYQDLLELSPVPANGGDYLVMESTYGNRIHQAASPVEELAKLVNSVIQQQGILLIPAFALGRAQVLLYCLLQVFKKNLAPKIPVFLNSPMATQITNLYQRFPQWHRLSPEESDELFAMPIYISSVEDSKELTKEKGPHIIISASGMITGGRVLHHLKELAPDPHNIILLPGFQAVGTRGELLVAGNKTLKIHGETVAIAAPVYHWDTLSAHADQEELLHWLRSCKQKPGKIYIVHGEPKASAALAQKIRDELGIETEIPHYESVAQF